MPENSISEELSVSVNQINRYEARENFWRHVIKFLLFGPRLATVMAVMVIEDIVIPARIPFPWLPENEHAPFLVLLKTDQ
jgi:hypothetical protein